jgi:hypothetical protein
MIFKIFPGLNPTCDSAPIDKKGGRSRPLATVFDAISSIPMRDAAVTGARSTVVFREADASVPTVCRALLVLTPARGGVNYLAIHIHVVAVVAGIGERLAGLANKADEYEPKGF